MLKNLFLLVLGFAVFASCKTGTDSTTSSELFGSEWTLTSVISPETGNRLIVKSAKKPTLLFDKTTGRVSGYAGCNRLNGAATVSGNTVKFDKMATTNMFCPEGMDMEHAVTKALESANSFEIKAGKLRLKQGTKVVAEYMK